MSDKNDKPDLTTRQLLTITTLQTVVMVAIGAGIWQFSQRPLGQFVSLDIPQTAYGVLLGVVLSVIGWACFTNMRDLTDKLVRMQGDTYFFLKEKLSPNAIIWISICAGVGEEALFRAGLQTILTDYLGPVAAIAIASLLFTLVHMAKPVISLILFAIGTLFGIIYWYTDSLLIVIIGHAVYDIFALSYLQKRLHELKFFDEVPPNDPHTE
ncbi:CPBP family intramembrane glutamic endopeptidase [Qipengyuania sp. DGS5-3]|uniref:CPBP family intramembrane glutamic endopeptidase n=1 Tax=Qipengyuania sp. DGS5-3 TaxID=3349632 RepID=UPI0036D20EC9